MSERNVWGNWDELIGLPPDELIAMARRRELELGLDPSADDHRKVINMLRHDYTIYDGRVMNAVSGRLYDEILDEIARDFPWLTEQCERDKATHPERVPLWVQAKHWARADAVERQRVGREAAKRLSVGSKVLVKWRGEREARIVEVRRSRVTTEFELPDGSMYKIDRPANEVKLIEGERGSTSHPKRTPSPGTDTA